MTSGNVLITRYLVGDESISGVGDVDHFETVRSISEDNDEMFKIVNGVR